MQRKRVKLYSVFVTHTYNEIAVVLFVQFRKSCFFVTPASEVVEAHLYDKQNDGEYDSHHFLFVSGCNNCLISVRIVCWREPEICLHKFAKAVWFVGVWL